MEILDVCNFFQICGAPKSAVPYGNGHINDTYKVSVDCGGREVHYILQKVNDRVFNNVSNLMKNISAVTKFLKNEIEREGGNPKRETLCLVPTVNGKDYAVIDGGFYRVYDFIEDCVSLDKPRSTYDFCQSSVAYAKFIKRLAVFDVRQLNTEIPNFHNTPKRVESLRLAVKNDKAERVANVKKELEWVEDRIRCAGKLTTLINTISIPTRVTHNDMKLNNVLLDGKSGEEVAVIDLDTVMKGSLLYDFGDAIRFGCNTTAENDANPSNVDFDIEMYKAYTESFIGEMKNYLTALEKIHLLYGAWTMTYECGVRFLSDYLNGDLYFKTSSSEENLYRARTQFRLVDKMEVVGEDLTAWAMTL